MTLTVVARKKVPVEFQAAEILRCLDHPVRWLNDETDLYDAEDTLVVVQPDQVDTLRWPGNHTRRLQSIPAVYLPLFAQHPACGFGVRRHPQGRYDTFKAAVVQAAIEAYREAGYRVPEKLLHTATELTRAACWEKNLRKTRPRLALPYASSFD